MGIYDRGYYRDATPPSDTWGTPYLTPAIKWIILANAAVFLLQIFVVREEHVERPKLGPSIDRLLAEYDKKSPEEQEVMRKKHPELVLILSNMVMQPPTRKVPVFQNWCEMDTKKVVEQGQVWRLLTAAFCHDRHGIFHILFNMFLLYWFGCTLESAYGSREFLLFYLTAAVAASLAFVGLDLYTGSTVPGIGASGAVMGVMMLYTTHFPYETIRVFWMIRLEMRWVMALYVIYDLHPILLTLAGDDVYTGIGHAAHLGGCLFGFLYAKYEWRLEPLLDRVSWSQGKVRRRPRLRLVSAPPPDLAPEEEADRVDDLLRKEEADRVDDLLRKISESGADSLTDEERAILREASLRAKERRERGS